MRSRWKIFSSRSLPQISPRCAASRARHEDGSLGERQRAQIGIRVVDLYVAFDTGTPLSRAFFRRAASAAALLPGPCANRVGQNHGPACVKTAGNFDPSGLRTVLPVADTDVFKALYYDREQAALRPNLTFIDLNGEIVFETNEVGLKGDPVDASRKLAVVWGDSVVFGSGRSWPCLLDRLAPGWQFLSGGLDGDPYSNILRRAAEFNDRHSVELNLLMLGWHHFVPARPVTRGTPRQRWFAWKNVPLEETWEPRSGNENLGTELVSFVHRVPNTVVLTTPTALNRHIVDHDLSSYLADGDDRTGFRFLGDIPYQLHAQRQGFEHITERNDIVREVCARLSVRTVD